MNSTAPRPPVYRNPGPYQVAPATWEAYPGQYVLLDTRRPLVPAGWQVVLLGRRETMERLAEHLNQAETILAEHQEKHGEPQAI